MSAIVLSRVFKRLLALLHVVSAPFPTACGARFWIAVETYPLTSSFPAPRCQPHLPPTGSSDHLPVPQWLGGEALLVLLGQVGLEGRMSQSAFARVRWTVLVAADARGRGAVSAVEELASFSATLTSCRLLIERETPNKLC